MKKLIKRLFLGRIMKESSNELELSLRERVMIKFFIKFVALLLINFTVWILPAPIVLEYVKSYKDNLLNTDIDVVDNSSHVHRIVKPAHASDIQDPIHVFEVSAETIRSVTMYNAGDVRQCDASPCISANGEDICLALELGYNRCAANFVPLGTHLQVDKLGTCLVTDRMNSRYPNRVDWALPFTEEQYQRALNFGVQKLNVKILK